MALAKSDVRYFDVKVVPETGKRICTNKHTESYTPVTALKYSTIGKYCSSMKILDLVESVCQLSVTVKVDMKSPDRKSKRNFDHYLETFSTDGPALGSGTIQNIGLMDTDSNYCEIEILTANHIVFDESEVKVTKCVLYFDDSQHQTASAEGIKMLKANDNDSCIFICKIESKEKAEIENNLATLNRNIKKFKTMQVSRKPKAILIAHPHGCHTYISMGNIMENHDNCITYDTPACKGSSGGYVIPVGCDYGVYIHSGHGVNGKNGTKLPKFNFSSGKIDQSR